jgi:assimilatory nitrate reductase catalytic subunit
VHTRLTPHIRLDTLFVPFHWGGDGRANLLTLPALDPLSKMPEFKVCAARIEAIEEQKT